MPIMQYTPPYNPDMRGSEEDIKADELERLECSFILDTNMVAFAQADDKAPEEYTVVFLKTGEDLQLEIPYYEFVSLFTAAHNRKD